jgi:Ca2+-binding RTX toxin-like protein
MFTHGVAAGDVDHDGDLDIVATQLHVSYLLRNNGDGNFTRTDGFLPWDNTIDSSQYNATDVHMFDANGDGWFDLVYGATGVMENNRSLLLINNKTGTFSDSSPIALPSVNRIGDAVIDISSADLDRDGDIDLVVTTATNNYTGNRVEILVNDGDGHFIDETDSRFSQSGNKGWLTATPLVDLNNDGHVDLVLSGFSGEGFGQVRQPFYINDGTGHFVRLPKSFLAEAQKGEPSRLSIFDANDDGRQDVLVYRRAGSTADYTMMLQADPGRKIKGSAASDALLGDRSKESVFGVGGNDVVFAAAGNDRLFGGSGRDYLNGGDGNDKVVGGSGSDRIVGGLGSDKLSGNGGRDIFDFNSVADSPSGSGRDLIVDFNDDRIDFQDIDANSEFSGNQAFTFIGADSFAAHGNVAGLIRIEMTGLVQADVNGDGLADFEVMVLSSKPLEANDFIL